MKHILIIDDNEQLSSQFISALKALGYIPIGSDSNLSSHQVNSLGIYNLVLVGKVDNPEAVFKVLDNQDQVKYARLQHEDQAIEEGQQGEFIHQVKDGYNSLVARLKEYFKEQGLPKLMVVYHDYLMTMNIEMAIGDLYTVIGATNLESAQKLIKEEKPDVMIVGNRFDRQPGAGDAMLDELTKDSVIPYLRISGAIEEIKRNKGSYVVDITRMGKGELLAQLITGLYQAFT